MSMRKPGRRSIGIVLWGAALLTLGWPALATGSTEQQGAAPAPAAPTAPPTQAGTHRTLQALGTTDLQTFIAGMEADRLLLAEIRKDLPDKRSDADLYLKRLKQLAGQSDPVHLVPKVNRLIEQEPIYYDWLEKNAASQSQGQQSQGQQSQSASDYVVGGARGFVIAFQDFQNALLLTVINRLDLAERALQEATLENPK